MRRLPVKQMFRTEMKTLLYCVLNLLVTLVVTYKKQGYMHQLSLIPSQVIKF